MNPKEIFKGLKYFFIGVIAGTLGYYLIPSLLAGLEGVFNMSATATGVIWIGIIITYATMFIIYPMYLVWHGITE